MSRLLVRIGNSSHIFTVFPWSTVIELKQEISQKFSIPSCHQKLYHGKLELNNSHRLNDYHLFSSKRHLRMLIKSRSGFFIQASQSTEHIDLEGINSALTLGLSPSLTMDGTGGTYVLRDINRHAAAIFKPFDEEPFAPHNPRGYRNTLGSPSLRQGVVSGEGGYREIVAYLIGSGIGVPETILAESRHESYSSSNSKLGSLQAYVNSVGLAEDFACNKFSVENVQQIAIFDIRILNMDRNLANLLVTKEFSLVPIDHGLSLPDCLEIYEYEICWMNWPHVKKPITESCIDTIKKIDLVSEIKTIMEFLPIREVCLKNMRIAGLLLKKGALAGLTLHDIGTMLYRNDEDERSIAEEIELKAQELYSVVKSVPTVLNERLSLVIKERVISRQRSYSNHELEDDSFPFQEAEDAVIEPVFEEDTCENETESTSPAIFKSFSMPPVKSFDHVSAKCDIHPFDETYFNFLEAFIDHFVMQKAKETKGRIRSFSEDHR